MSLIRVLLVDDHPVVRSGIRGLLEKVKDIELVGEAADGENALRMIAETNPDVLLLDLELPDIQGTQVAQRVKSLYPNVKILVLSAHDDSIYVRELLQLGAAGYLMKEEAPELIVEAVRGIAHGEQGWVSRRIAAQMAAWVQNGDPENLKLTLREHEVLRRIVQGKTNQTIAHEMNISEKTVEKYIQAIFSKLNVSSRVEAAVHAVKEGLV
jgi:NarL family two-component system response regulator LiaR